MNLIQMQLFPIDFSDQFKRIKAMEGFRWTEAANIHKVHAINNYKW